MDAAFATATLRSGIAKALFRQNRIQAHKHRMKNTNQASGVNSARACKKISQPTSKSDSRNDLQLFLSDETKVKSIKRHKIKNNGCQRT